MSILDDVSFESFLIRRLHVKGPHKPFLLPLMRNKIAPEEKKKKGKLFILHSLVLGKESSFTVGMIAKFRHS